MATGACGIDCSVCRLNLLGECSTCGSGKSIEGAKKRGAQERILGAPCPILACAIDNNVEFCPKDCDDFPCNNFRDKRYPFSEGYLNMQERRRQAPPPSLSPIGERVVVPGEYWHDLANSNMGEICRRAMAVQRSASSVILPFLNSSLLVDAKKREGYVDLAERWVLIDHPLTLLMALVYLLNATEAVPMDQMVGVQELKSAHFFQGPHKLKTGSVLKRYGNNPEGFKNAAMALGGQRVDLADLAFKFTVFPKIPIYYLLWNGDDEFPANLVVLFDKSIEKHLAADSIWGMVNLVSDLLVLGQGISPLIARG
ncbi:MAG: hypothetical protein DRH15_10730 [Deltaproteobacteria bacterium]|nr:MAG: hypothetical protein DRH15_10730 [Deltaproteobacteria bacterium]